LYQEEENQEVQDMIAKFYTKFDDLHEHSIGQALARSPNKVHMKNEVKYKIPERWTKKFHKHDIVPLQTYKDKAVKEERGRVNKMTVVDKGN
jgi:glutamyl-tRNA reductase